METAAWPEAAASPAAQAAQQTTTMDPNLSTFEGRWTEALGAPGSDAAQDFNTSGAKVSAVWKKISADLKSLLNTPCAETTDGLKFKKIGPASKFMGLEKQIDFLIIRPFYDSLYQKIADKWDSKSNRVLLSGNAGTGKSWFQVFALLQLLKGFQVDHNYLFVIRQVRHEIYLIDFATGDVRELIVHRAPVDVLDLFNEKHVLYFFEPLDDRSILPLPVSLSSLTTLSPYEERIHEYEKNRLTRLIFPCWDYEHLLTIFKMDQKARDVDLTERYSRFGGIILHVLSSDLSAFDSNQRSRISEADLTILRATTTGIDSDPKAPGKNVSGYLLCYCNIPTTGPDRFEKWQLDFTSNFVRDEIRKRLSDYRIEEHINIVADCLSNKQEDRGGLHLQETIASLLGKGSVVSWKFAEAVDGGVRWSSFQTRSRELIKRYGIRELLGASDKVLVSTNPNFPLADIVFSAPPPAAVIDSFQVSWRDSHPFTVRALYMLRHIHLGIADTVQLRVFFVVPNKEDTYAARPKQRFLNGNIQKDLDYSNNVKIPSSRLQLMWQNTKIFVLKPNISWIDTLLPYG
mmetsp:Transcript_722/g.1430  ORF Transcript_722/g.1430 Transcript_722/m.1430 type:complete len:573 (-) Transcript_722:187-1905(-)